MKNTIYTIEEYIAQGFTAEEAPKVRKTDEMFNNWDNLTEEEKKEYIKSLVADMPAYDGDFETLWPYYGLFFTIHYAQARVLFKREEFSLEKEFRLYVDLVEEKFQHEAIELFLQNKPDELSTYRK